MLKVRILSDIECGKHSLSTEKSVKLTKEGGLVPSKRRETPSKFHGVAL